MTKQATSFYSSYFLLQERTRFPELFMMMHSTNTTAISSSKDCFVINAGMSELVDDIVNNDRVHNFDGCDDDNNNNIEKFERVPLKKKNDSLWLSVQEESETGTARNCCGHLPIVRSFDSSPTLEQRQQQQITENVTGGTGTTTLVGRDEGKTVLKLTVLALLISSAITVGVVTYWYLQQSERSKFYDIYRDDATKVAQSLYSAVINTFASLDLVATAIVAHADKSNDTFPFVTFPHYANHAAKVLSMSVSISLWVFFFSTSRRATSMGEICLVKPLYC